VKALSGYAEWFWLMAKNYKDVENRNWPLSRFIQPGQLPIRVYLHASKTPASREEIEFIHSLLDDYQWNEFCEVDWDRLRGNIIGEITIMGCVTELASDWFFGKYGFTVQNGELYLRPIPYRGQLGFFEVELPTNPVSGREK
jgi:hypothetical protein